MATVGVTLLALFVLSKCIGPTNKSEATDAKNGSRTSASGSPSPATTASPVTNGGIQTAGKQPEDTKTDGKAKTGAPVNQAAQPLQQAAPPAPVKISLAAVCREQFPGSTLQTSSDPQNNKCVVAGPSNTTPHDAQVDQYCGGIDQSSYDAGSRTWTCNSSGNPVNFSDLCIQQYGAGAVAQNLDPDHPYGWGWKCLVTTQTSAEYDLNLNGYCSTHHPGLDQAAVINGSWYCKPV